MAETPSAILNQVETARELRQLGYPCSATALAYHIQRGAVPYEREGREIMIRWGDALGWAIFRWDGKGEAMPDSILLDQLVYYCKTNFPDDWLRLNRVAGPHRRELLDLFGEHVISTIREAWRDIIASQGDAQTE